MDILIQYYDEVYCKIIAEKSIIFELWSLFTFKAPNYQWHPKYKAKMWNGEIHLINLNTGLVYVGLIPKIVKLADKNNYSLEIDPKLYPIAFEKTSDFFDKLELQAHGESIKIRDYQEEAFNYCIKNNRATILSPTASGKSLIIYSLIRFLQPEVEGKILLIVPTTHLLEQMYSDFHDYSTKNGWDVSKNCHKIFAGQEKGAKQQIFISTWQSIYELRKDYFEQFDVIIADEVHQYKANCLKGIMEKSTKTKFRFGFTGTLDGMICNELVVRGLFGSVYRATTTKELMEKKEISELKIDMIHLKYSPEEVKEVNKLTYHEEIEWLFTNQKRNQFIIDLSRNLKGNTLILFSYVKKHGIPLYEMLKANLQNRPVYLVCGKIEAEDREEIRKIVEKEENAIIVASYQCYSTGVSIRRLHNIVFSSSTKSLVRVLQSIGRGLRKANDKMECRLFDIVDDLSYETKSGNIKQNYGMDHALERYAIFDKEKFDYRTITIQL